MNIKHLRTTNAGHDFALWDNGAEQLRFTVPPDFTENGHVHAYTGNVWPGSWSAAFESPPLSEATDLHPCRVRLKAVVVNACCNAINETAHGRKLAMEVAATATMEDGR